MLTHISGAACSGEQLLCQRHIINHFLIACSDVMKEHYTVPPIFHDIRAKQQGNVCMCVYVHVCVHVYSACDKCLCVVVPTETRFISSFFCL